VLASAFFEFSVQYGYYAARFPFSVCQQQALNQASDLSTYMGKLLFLKCSTKTRDMSRMRSNLATCQR